MRNRVWREGALGGQRAAMDEAARLGPFFCMEALGGTIPALKHHVGQKIFRFQEERS